MLSFAKLSLLKAPLALMWSQVFGSLAPSTVASGPQVCGPMASGPPVLWLWISWAGSLLAPLLLGPSGRALGACRDPPAGCRCQLKDGGTLCLCPPPTYPRLPVHVPTCLECLRGLSLQLRTKCFLPVWLHVKREDVRPLNLEQELDQEVFGTSHLDLNVPRTVSVFMRTHRVHLAVL